LLSKSTVIKSSNYLKNKVLLPQVHVKVTLDDFWLSCLGPLLFLLPKISIIWLSNLLALSIPDEGYSRNMQCALILMSTFLFQNYLW